MSLRDLLPERPAEDVLAGRLRLSLGGVEHVLPVLTIGANERWQTRVSERVGGLLSGLAATEASAENASGLLGMLASLTGVQLELIRLYDASGVLPEDDWIREHATDAQVFAAFLAVWGAANPLAVTVAQTTGDLLPLLRTVLAASSPGTSSPPRNGAGRRVPSGRR